MADARAFVVFAEMRTGSNHLEESLAGIEGVRTFGEAFNPVFLGAPDRDGMLGFDRAARDADPRALLAALVAAPGLTGFRFFHDHDPRVLDAILEDRRIAKVVLTRNPLDSYVSLAIAHRTGQWRLTNPRMARAAKVRFDGAAFDALVARQAAFGARVAWALQVSGQGAFRLRYEEIGDLDVLNGLAAFLGAPGRLAALPGRLVRQNPGDVSEKVENPDEMRAHLAGLNPFALSRSIDPEPPRGPAVPTMMTAARSPLLALPVPGGPDGAVRDWLAALDGAPPTEGMTQKALRPWMRGHKGFTSFAVLRHPMLRAHGAFRDARAAGGAAGRRPAPGSRQPARGRPRRAGARGVPGLPRVPGRRAGRARLAPRGAGLGEPARAPRRDGAGGDPAAGDPGGGGRGGAGTPGRGRGAARAGLCAARRVGARRHRGRDDRGGLPLGLSPRLPHLRLPPLDAVLSRAPQAASEAGVSVRSV